MGQAAARRIPASGAGGTEIVVAARDTIAGALEADFYFALLYCSWERGRNENTNGLVRQYFPKGSDFSTLTVEHNGEVMDKLNHRPRKILDYRTPYQAFFLDEQVALRT